MATKRDAGNRSKRPRKRSSGDPLSGDDTDDTEVGALPETFPIVAIGGSAGSLTAFQQILGHLPSNARLALVIVSHQDPDRPSMLAEILAKSTALPVAQVTDGMQARPAHVYVAPPGHFLGIRAGTFHLEQHIERGHPPLPVDHFMRALARDRESRAVGIVVSGTGSDGTLGLGAIRSEAGLTLAQQPEQAEFGGMPGSAIAAGVVDLVASPQEIADRLVRHARRISEPPPPTPKAPPAAEGVERIVQLVGARTRQDFSGYKRGTLQRRIERRLQLHGLTDLSDYLRFVGQHPEELDALRRDWLIGVSSFFRDPEAYRALEAAILEMVRERPDGSSLRAWVPGCASGQEAYSIAMVVIEAADTLGKRLEPQIFATDLDEVAIEVARAGRYPEGIAAEVSPERLRRFFAIDERYFVVKKDVREHVVFAIQNLLRDPPFTRMDLISCRNLLIYLDNDTQKRILPLFHYSLNPDGILFLGSSESITSFEELFSVVDRERRIFRRTALQRAQFSASDWAAATAFQLRHSGLPESRSDRLDLGELLRRQLTNRYAPPAVIVDEHGTVEQIHGRTGEYLEPAPGRPRMNVFDMARDGLRAALVSVLRGAARNDPRAAEATAGVRANGGHRQVRLRASRLDESRFARPLFLVAFEPAEAAGSLEPTVETGTPKALPGERVAQLEEQIRSAREDHQSTIEELQAANEELASANEEVQSVNEELQSANEELQTSKEETQSLNEELHTVNAELQAKLGNLEQANDDLRNLMDSTGIAIVFVDEHLRLKRFTPAARALIPLIASDIGRPLADISISLADRDLLAEAEQVLARLAPSDREVRSNDGRWYAVQIRPYRTARNTIEGLSIAFLDITRLKRAEDAARSFESNIMQTVRAPLLVLDAELNVVRANRCFYRAFRVDPKEVEGRCVFDLGNGQWNVPRLRELLERLLRENASFEDFEVDHDFPGLGRRSMLLDARRIKSGDSSEAELILLAIEDVTATRRSGD